jgi:hypothetical protein
MRISETKFNNSLVSNVCKGLPASFNVLWWCFVLLCSGCVNLARTEVSRETMLNNVNYWKKTCATVTPGQVVVPLPPSEGPGIRVYAMRWDKESNISDLLSRMKQVTHEGLDLDTLKIDEGSFIGKKVKDLPTTEQTRLRGLWEKRIIDALTTKYFDTAPDILAEGIRQDDLVFYYLLVGRHDSAEMGHSDEVEMMCVNSKGRLVAKVRERYGWGYPIGFIDQRGVPAKYLF